ncbi:MAG TPA: response regulator transcription factor [Acidimicrobiia bacterium]|nr:response regulator transcription factor [Acidimicrobiia bacterium]
MRCRSHPQTIDSALWGYRGSVKILLVDDHEIVRRGIRGLLEGQEDFTVVGEAASAAEAVRRTGFDSPDLVIMDVRLPDASGVEACRDIRSGFPDVKVLMLTSYADEEALMSAILAGASGYLLKRIDSAELIESVRKVGRGESLLDPEMVTKLFSRLRGGAPSDPLLSRLSEQERRILDLIAAGRTNRQIAEDMFLAEKTVKNYVSNLLGKLGMARRSEAAAYVARVTSGTPSDPPEEWKS